MDQPQESKGGSLFQFAIYFLILVAIAAFIYFTQRDETIAPPETPAVSEEQTPLEPAEPTAAEQPAAGDQTAIEPDQALTSGAEATPAEQPPAEQPPAGEQAAPQPN